MTTSYIAADFRVSIKGTKDGAGLVEIPGTYLR